MEQSGPPSVGVWFKVILVHLHCVITSSGTSDRLRCGFLVILGGFFEKRHLRRGLRGGQRGVPGFEPWTGRYS
jgi:hypothetical protein